MKLMSITKATKLYEAWLTTHIPVVAEDLLLKHQQMALGVFPFLRATFYRWAQVWPEVCARFAAAPVVLAVGDLHVENFGTWRDAEGRLVWGVNDFDEACYLPYTNDLTRLATSALLAIDSDHLRVKPKTACEVLLEGYTDGLKAGGKPFVLAEDNEWLRKLAQSELRDPILFWQKMDRLPTVTTSLPTSAKEGLESLLPASGLKYTVKHRIAGLGSLGRQRFVAVAEYAGGRVAREVKALLPSAYLWAHHNDSPKEILYQAALSQAVRCPDPFVQLRGQWIARRLAPDCSRVELTALPNERDDLRLLHAMGRETANIHLGSPTAVAAIRRDLRKRAADWLSVAGEEMMQATLRDWEGWRIHQQEENPPSEARRPAANASRRKAVRAR